ncbi:macroglobulin / complement [Anaeramoeba flamelloides]|uniref:Macroglobulin / complement n=1 Tax=Anaeramoeba flamelloides TaxID=1746091 RepID=A0AAV7YLI9_9EUKA|nr:macroglobulin / complement [Anaeramoeba flamelloides]
MNQLFLQESFSNPRFSLHLTTDKQNYNPGDVVMCRGILLDVFTHKPLIRKNFNIGKPWVRIKSPDKSELVNKELNSSSVDSVYSFTHRLTEDQTGGEYLIEFYHQNCLGVAMATRKFTVQTFEQPMFKTDLEFVRRGYGPCDTVEGYAVIERAEGGIPVKANISGKAVVDGDVVWEQKGLTIDKKSGRVTFEFELPEEMDKGEGTINLSIQEGGALGNSSKTIPILLQKLDVVVYPEGGELIMGLLNGVYFECTNPITGEPADCSGVLLENGKKTNIKFQTLHEGRGVFEFTPKKKKSYKLKFNYPTGIKSVPIEKKKIHGVAIRLLSKKSIKLGEKIYFEISCTQKDNKRTSGLKIVFSKREKEIHSQQIGGWEEVGESNFVTQIVCNPYPYDGVLRATVVDGGGLPLCERLVFVEPEESLVLDCRTERKAYSPGDTVKLNIKSQTSRGVDVPAFLCVTVSDDSIYKMNEKRKRLPRLPEMYYLENEVQELKDPRNYLFPDQIVSRDGGNQKDEEENENESNQGGNTNIDPKICVDLLLGTQGWRRFCYKDKEKFYNEKTAMQDKIKRLFAIENNRAPLIIEKQIYRKLETRSATRGVRNRGNVKVKKYKKKRSKGAKQLSKSKSKPTFRKSSQKVQKAMNKKVVAIKPKVNLLKPSSKVSKKKMLDKSSFLGGKSKSKKIARRPRRVPQMKIYDSESESSDEEDEFDDFNYQFGYNEICKGKKRIRFLREYAHPRRSNWDEEERIDFVNTLYFNNCKKTVMDSKTGEFATAIEFDLNDSISSFRVFVDCFDEQGRMGCNQTFVFNSLKSFYVEPKLPNEVSLGDFVRFPINMVNNYQNDLERVELLFEAHGQGLQIVENNYWKGKLLKNERVGKRFSFAIEDLTKKEKKKETEKETEREKEKEKAATDMEVNEIVCYGIELDRVKMDQVKKPINVKPPGFPLVFPISGIIKGDSYTEKFSIELPGNIFKNWTQTSISIHPSTLTQLTKSVKSLICIPSGCFEQTTSKSFPMVMAIQYLEQNQEYQNEKLLKSARSTIIQSTQRLLSYRVRGEGGFSCFGSPPSNLPMTSYGLMQFYEIQKVNPAFNKDIIRTTVQFLLKKRNNSGGFSVYNPRLKHYYGRRRFKRIPTGKKSVAGGNQRAQPNNENINAYILWALTCCGVTKGTITKEYNCMVNNAQNDSQASKDCYFLALASLTCFNLHDTDLSKQFADRLLEYADEKGTISDCRNTLVYSYGNNKSIEVTALSVLAFIKNSMFEEAAKSVEWINSMCKSGRFGTTQATVLSLKAINAWNEINSVPINNGELILHINNSPVKSTQIVKGSSEEISIKDFGEYLRPNETNIVQLQMKGGSVMPFEVSIEARTPKPNDRSEDCDIQLTTEVLNDNNSNDDIVEGDVIQFEVTIENRTLRNDPTGMVVAVIGIPGGCSVRIDKLKQLKQVNTFDFFELFGAREVAFYWENVDPSQVISFTIDLIAEIAGNYTAPHSRAYLYYNDDFICWNDGINVEILPKGGNEEQQEKEEEYSFIEEEIFNKKKSLTGLQKRKKEKLIFPTTFGKYVNNDKIKISHAKNLILYQGTEKDNEIIVRSDFPIPKSCKNYYFEMTVVQTSKLKYLGIGLVPEEHDLSGMPGWVNSIGYHGDDGSTFICNGEPSHTLSIFQNGDVIGLGWDKEKMVFYFTKNGKLLKEVAKNHELMKKTLYPCFGFSSYDIKIIANFGKKSFAYKKMNQFRFK